MNNYTAAQIIALPQNTKEQEHHRRAVFPRRALIFNIFVYNPTGKKFKYRFISLLGSVDIYILLFSQIRPTSKIYFSWYQKK